MTVHALPSQAVAGDMRRPVSTLLCEGRVKSAVFGVVVGAVVLPAAPEDAGPCSPEDADGVGVVAAAVAGALVDVARPGVVVSCGVGEDADVCPQALVAGPSECGVAALAGLDRDGCLSGVGGERLGAGVAGAVIADLGEQAGCGDDALAVAEEGQEDRSVWVGSEGASDLTGELADLLNDGSQRGDDGESRQRGVLRTPARR